MKHCFVVCAYQDSPYLPQCLDSLAAQESPSPLLLCTATPSPYLEGMARRYGASYHVNPSAPGIGTDWDFALACAREAGFDWVTLCHQDDLYLPGYGAALKEKAGEDALIYFSDYGEKRGDAVVTTSRLLTIKRLLLWRMRLPAFQKSAFMKHRTLALGDPICCPAVSYHLPLLPLPLFQTEMTTSLDWQAWERISRLPGRFCYDPRVMMLHRIHAQSTTTQVLHKGGRIPEDYAMFRKFWCAPLAKILTGWYSTSEKSNQVEAPSKKSEQRLFSQGAEFLPFWSKKEQESNFFCLLTVDFFRRYSIIKMYSDTKFTRPLPKPSPWDYREAREVVAMTIGEFYALMGADWEDVLHRLGTEARVLKILAMLLQDQSMAQLNQAMDEKDYAGAFRAAHTLKGIALNLGLAHLAQSASQLTETLRPQQYAPALAREYAQVATDYREAERAIHTLLESK